VLINLLRINPLHINPRIADTGWRYLNM